MNERIVVDPKICGGEPTVRGTRIPVSLVLQMLEGGDSIDDILRGYPSLSRRAVQTGIHFASEVIERNRLSSRVLTR